MEGEGQRISARFTADEDAPPGYYDRMLERRRREVGFLLYEKLLEISSLVTVDTKEEYYIDGQKRKVVELVATITPVVFRPPRWYPTTIDLLKAIGWRGRFIVWLADLLRVSL